MFISRLWATLTKATSHYGHPPTEITGKSREEVIVRKGSTLNIPYKFPEIFFDRRKSV
jgi:hypothetical protein